MAGIATLHSDIRAAFRAKLQTVSGLPSTIEWEGKEANPSVDQPYMRETVTPIFSDPRALGRGGTIQHRILCRAKLFFPSDNGTLAIETAAGKLLEAFPPGSSLVYGATSGMVFKTETSGLITETAFISLTVTITVTAYSAN
jgi:hypothetical protein